MQLIKAQRDALLRPLQTVSGIVERRNTLPILANILIRKEGEAITFLATDIEVQITTHANCGVGKESAATTVAARKMLDILRSLPDSSDVAVSMTDKRMTIQAGKSRFSMQTLPAEEFPTTAESEYAAAVSMPQKALRQLLHMVHFAMAQADVRYYLNGLLLVVNGQTITAVATDGHRLALCETQVEEDLGRQDVIIPRKTILELQRLLEDVDAPVKIELSSSRAKFTFGTVELVSKLVEGKFPDYNRVIPTKLHNNFVVSREQLQRSLQRAAIMTSDKFKGVRFKIAPGLLQMSAANSDQEESVEEMEIDYGGDVIEMGFNVTYLLDVLGNLKTEQVKMSFGDALSSAMLSIPNNDQFKYVVMPMRI